MSLEALKEITVWSGVKRQPNHTYLFDGDRAVAYRKWHTGKVEWFKNPCRIDKRRRKFEAVSIKRFGKILYTPEPKVIESAPTITKDEVEVKGSKGNVYVVNKSWRTCSCPGFTFRRKCRHIDEVLNG